MPRVARCNGLATLSPDGGTAVNIKSPLVDGLIGQLRQITGRGATDIVREPLERELQRQRRIRRSAFQQDLSPLQDQAATLTRPFDASELYGADSLPG